MQREKLYNLHKIAYLIVAIIVYENGQHFILPIFAAAKIGCKEFCFF
jgi:hypothetical protein